MSDVGFSLTPAFWISPAQQRRTAPRFSGSPSSPPYGPLSACRCFSPLRTGLESRRSPLSAESQNWRPSFGWSRSDEPRSKDRRFGTWKCSSRRAVKESLASRSSSLCVKAGWRATRGDFVCDRHASIGFQWAKQQLKSPSNDNRVGPSRLDVQR